MFLRRSAQLKDSTAEDFQSRAYEAGSIPVTITCPQCGISRSGSAEDVLQWRAEHHCRTRERPAKILRFPIQFPGKQGRN